MSRVAVLAGGRSSEREVSLVSGASVAEGLIDAGHQVVSVEIDTDGRWLRAGEPMTLTPGQGIDSVDVVFPVVHGPWGEDGTLQGLLESLRVPYVGSGVYASALCIDKLLAKERLAQAGIAQVDFVAVTADSWAAERESLSEQVGGFGLPLWVKPARLGSSVGISRVDQLDQLTEAVELALKHDPRVIIEASSSGREIEVSVMEVESPEGRRIVASSAGEITLPGAAEGEWYDYERKYKAGGMELVVPADLSAEDAAATSATAISAFQACGCEDYARVDCFVEPGKVLINEINTAPGFTRTSVFASLFEAGGISYPQVLDTLISSAVAKSARRERYLF